MGRIAVVCYFRARYLSYVNCFDALFLTHLFCLVPTKTLPLILGAEAVGKRRVKAYTEDGEELLVYELLK